MSTELTSFLFGIPAVLLWCTGLKKGLMLGPYAKRVLKEHDPLQFWLCATISGVIAIGLLVGPVLSWLGLR